jgi:osmotically-inducible protein OsmY
MRRLALFTAAGAALAYFFDPQSGRRRRHVTADRAAASVRHLGKRARRLAHRVTADLRAARIKAEHREEEPKPQPNDATLVQKVESEVFRDHSIPKGRINVNAENGVVVLRGQVESPDLVQHLESAVRDVHGVRDVRNLLHVAGDS